ncbi:hypothetical protein O9929_01990 [Vibrio lentus]|nr:hypothetical protein [Vibrio lentus]
MINDRFELMNRRFYLMVSSALLKISKNKEDDAFTNQRERHAIRRRSKRVIAPMV